MKRILFLLFLLLSLRVSAGVFLDRLVASRAIDPRQSALIVTELASGEIVDSLNTASSLIPASILKSATIAALLPESGCGYRYLTDVFAAGPIKDGILEGDLLIVGSGDPTINAGCDPPGPDFISEIAEALRKAGISSIEGKISVDSSVFPGPAVPPSWAAADTKQKYGTGCHGFNFRHNASGSSAVADPSSVFVSALKTKLAGEGIRVKGNSLNQKGKHKKLFTHSSASIDEIMRSCMMRSDNLFAEALLRTIPLVKGKEATTEQAAALETLNWEKRGVPLEGVTIIDGSGLSRSNRVTARFIEAVLASMASDPDYASFFPLAGQEGTLKSFLKDTPLDSYLALKTGSMNGIQCYAGYKLDEDYVPTHSIVVILNALPKGRAAARSALETYFLDLFSSSQPE